MDDKLILALVSSRTWEVLKGYSEKYLQHKIRNALISSDSVGDVLRKEFNSGAVSGVRSFIAYIEEEAKRASKAAKKDAERS